jgi:pyridoxamine 5'-phosphate oxidase
MSPFEFFNNWYRAAEQAKVIEPYAFVLSTVNSEGNPRSRVVLHRLTESETFYFFTNYTSDKGNEILNNSHVAMNFHWREPEHRQVRVQGTISKASAKISDAYFASRPRGSQIGAWSSPQSREITSAKELQQLVQQFEEKFEGKEVPRPEFWGGFGISPTYFEFWQEGESRLHSRTVFEKEKASWRMKTLAP